jgi:hypothetical protein
MNILFVLSFLISSLAFAQAPTVIKNANQGGTIEFYTNQSGTITKKGEVTAAGQFSLLNGLSITGSLTGVTNITASGTVDGGVVKVGDGAAATPSLQLSNSPSTGLYRVGADSLGFATSGTSRGNVSSAGMWTLGTASGVQNHVVNGASMKIQNASYPSSINLAGGGSSTVHGYLLTTATETSRGGGTFIFNDQADIEYFVGKPYNNEDFRIMKYSTASHSENAADPAQATSLLTATTDGVSAAKFVTPSGTGGGLSLQRTGGSFYLKLFTVTASDAGSSCDTACNAASSGAKCLTNVTSAAGGTTVGPGTGSCTTTSSARACLCYTGSANP